MNRLTTLLVTLMLVFGVSFWSAPVLVAGEHGGSTVKEHGGGEHVGTSLSGDAQALLDAASELGGSNPALAAKLKSIAKNL